MVGFKKGDRVRVLPGHGMGHYGAKDGMIGVVNENNSDVPYVTLPGIDFDVAFRQVSLEHAPLFAVGDKVRPIHGGLDYVAGKAYPVTRIVKGGVWIEDDIGDNNYIPFDHVEPADTAAKFKVGDRVTTKSGFSFDPTAGTVGALPDGNSNLYKVDVGDGKGAHWNYFEEELTLADTVTLADTPTLTITAGKFYKTRDGRKVGPMEECATTAYDTDERLLGCDIDGMTRLFRQAGGAHLFGYEYLDLIAEWPTDSGCAAAQVDNLRDEYGPYGEVVKEQKFKVGDTVKIVRHCNAWGDAVKLELPVGSAHTIVDRQDRVNGLDTYILSGGDINFYTFRNLELASPTTTPAIVCLIDNGQPLPSHRPHVHATTEAATTEAERLAGVNKGQEFGVFVLAATKKEAKPTYKHEWQRLAADGKKLNAIRVLRELTGLALATSKDAVENWLQREAA